MRKTYLTIMFLMITVGTAYAGVFDTIKENAIGGIITVVFVAIAGIFGKKWLKFKKPIQALVEVYQEIKDAKDAKSEKGKDISKKEYEEIFEKIGALIEALIEVIPAKWLPKNK